MRLPVIFVLGLLGASLAAAQERFEAGGQFGYGGFLEDEHTGGRALAGGHFGVRLNDSRSLLFDYTQIRYSRGPAYRQRNHLFGLTLHTEPRPWNRLRGWADLGAGAGVRTRRYRGREPGWINRSQSFAGVHAGVGVAFDLGERFFVRPGVRAYLWAPSVTLGLAPVITAGFRF